MRRLRFLSWIDCYVFVRALVVAFFFGFTPLLLLKIFFRSSTHSFKCNL